MKPFFISAGSLVFIILIFAVFDRDPKKECKSWQVVNRRVFDSRVNRVLDIPAVVCAE